ncbi:hypothetical protein [Nonomuraea aridisoli]|uniref:hypothetical protein n=1 Tax=Nonomuraea aridisoli TaxID=2070368 RepID=UPI0011B94759|nr:hypothetical protein [Nonomuraea aridisoli]
MRNAQTTWRSDAPHDELLGISYGNVGGGEKPFAGAGQYEPLRRHAEDRPAGVEGRPCDQGGEVQRAGPVERADRGVDPPPVVAGNGSACRSSRSRQADRWRRTRAATASPASSDMAPPTGPTVGGGDARVVESC